MKHVAWGVMLGLALTGCVVVTPDFAMLTPAPTIIPTSTVAPATPTPQSPINGEEAEYYRGVYDLCQFINSMSDQQADCLRLVEIARNSDWYKQDSPGWDWVRVAPETLSY